MVCVPGLVKAVLVFQISPLWHLQKEKNIYIEVTIETDTKNN